MDGTGEDTLPVPGEDYILGDGLVADLGGESKHEDRRIRQSTNGGARHREQQEGGPPLRPQSAHNRGGGSTNAIIGMKGTGPGSWAFVS